MRPSPMGRTGRSVDKTLSFSLLGSPDIRLGDRPLPALPSRKALALLVYLAVESSRSHDRKALALLLWPDASLENGLGSLRQSLLVLRRVLGDERLSLPFLKTDPRTVAFNTRTSHRLDLTLFESPPPDCRVLEDPGACLRCADQLMGAVDSIRGPFLEGFDLPDCEEFEAWVEGVRERTRTHASRAIEQLVRIRTNAGDLPEAIRIATLGLRIDPFDEGGHRRLMRLFAASGNRRAAELQFESCRNILVREMGVPPSPETMALLREITEKRENREEVLKESKKDVGRSPVTVVFFDGLCQESLEDQTSPEGESQNLPDKIPEFIRKRGGVPFPTHAGGWMARFGVGPFREGSARRAARTALELVEFFRTAASSVRAGIHSALVKTADPSGWLERSAMLLCMEAEPGEIRVSDSAQFLFADQFRVETIPAARTPPGVESVYRLLGVSDGPTMESWAEKTGLVGRTQELSLFERIWSGRRGGIVLLEGPPGIGKSRLLRAFAGRALSGDDRKEESGPPVIRILECLPQYTNSPYFPVIRLLRSLVGIPSDLVGSQGRKRIDSYVLSLGLPHHESASLLSDLMGLSPSLQNFSGRPFREALENLFLSILRIRGQRRLLLAVEDIHWSDDSTRNALRTVLEDPRLSDKMVTVLTVRQGESPDWIASLPNLHRIRLSPLTEEEGLSMLRSLSEKRALPEKVAADILRSSGGIPLFLREAVKIFQESPGESDRVFFSPPRHIDEILSERLRRFPEDLPFLQRAAVVGQVVPMELFRAISPESPERLEGFFRRAEHGDLILRKDLSSGEVFEFCHSLVRDAVLRSQTLESYRHWHRVVAETLLERFPHTAENNPELLAHHFEEAKELAKSIFWYEKSSQRALMHGAFVEGENHAEKALHLLGLLRSPSPESEHQETRLHLLLGKIRTETRGLGTRDVGQAFQKALSLSSKKKNPSKESFLSFYGHFRSMVAQGRLFEAHRVLEDLAGMEKRFRDPDFRRMVLFSQGCLSFWKGDFSPSLEALSLLLEETASAKGPRTPEGEAIFRQSSAYRSWGYWFTGQIPSCRKELGRLEGWAKESDHPLRGFCLTFACNLYRYLGNEEKVLEKAEEIIEWSRDRNTDAWLPTGLGFKGWVLAKKGDPEGLNLLYKSLPMARRVHRVAENVFLSMLAEAYLILEDNPKAEGILRSAKCSSARSGVRFYDAELWRLEGECDFRRQRVSQARENFETALRLGENQGARLLALRAALSLGSLLLSEKKPEKDLPGLLAPFRDLYGGPGADPSLPEVRTARERSSRAVPLKNGTNVRSFGSRPRPRRDVQDA